MFYPVMIDLKKLDILIIGAGAIASKKAKSLIKNGASLKVIAVNICDEMLELKEKIDSENDIKNKKIDTDNLENINKDSVDSFLIDEVKEVLDIKRIYDENLSEIDKVMNSKAISSDIIKDGKEYRANKKVGELILIEREFNISDLSNVDMVYIATNNSALNKEIADYCINNKILVNSVDNHEQSSFINTGFFEEKINGEEILIAVSSKGKNPKNTKKIKNEIKSYFEKNYR